MSTSIAVRRTLFAAVVSAGSLVAGLAGAQTLAPPPPPAFAPPPGYGPPPGAYAPRAPANPDGGRFRGGVAAEGGVFIVPQVGGFSLPYGGVQGQLGYQINDLVGIYALPSFDILFGSVSGLNLSAAAIVDFTFDDKYALGVGPDSGVFFAFGGSSGPNGSSAAAAAAVVYGARAHFAFYPLMDKAMDHARRKGLQIGADFRFLVGAVGAAQGNSNTGTTGSVSASGVVLSPQITVGYSAF